jgi:hypothetical protein
MKHKQLAVHMLMRAGDKSMPPLHIIFPLALKSGQIQKQKTISKQIPKISVRNGTQSPLHMCLTRLRIHEWLTWRVLIASIECLVGQEIRALWRARTQHVSALVQAQHTLRVSNNQAQERGSSHPSIEVKKSRDLCRPTHCVKAKGAN